MSHGQRLGASSKKHFLVKFCLIFLAFSFVFIFLYEKQYFNQLLGCAAPNFWLKYTIMILSLLRP